MRFFKGNEIKFFNWLFKKNIHTFLYVLIVKSVLFIWFHHEYTINTPPHLFLSKFYISSFETGPMLIPVYDYLQGIGYSSMCKMPGLLPIYMIIGLFFNKVVCLNILVFLQFIADVIATWLFGKTIIILSKSNRIAGFTLIIWCFAPFSAIWVHIGSADSFGLSLLLISFYFYVKGMFKSFKPYHFFFAGIFATWYVFFRVYLLVFPAFFTLIIIWQYSKYFNFALKCLVVYSGTIILSLIIWGITNELRLGAPEIIPTGTYDCYSPYRIETNKMRYILTTWGEDPQPWRKEGIAYWIYNTRNYEGMKAEFNHIYFTENYKEDSLMKIKELFNEYLDTPVNSSSLIAGIRFSKSAEKYLEEYRNLHYSPYYFGSSAKLIYYVFYHRHLDYLPFPEFQKMNWFQKLYKGFFFIFLLVAVWVGAINAGLRIFYLDFFGLPALISLLALPVLFGLVEQLFINPCLPFFTYYTVMVYEKIVTGRQGWLPARRPFEDFDE